ncbi:MAG TPA: nucleotidyl transferase AbiEii/AbiGii toxin family protein [Trichocoleus sp.]
MKTPQDLPFLKAVCWQLDEIDHLTPQEKLQRYERGWQYRGVLADLSAEEAAFVRELGRRYGSWLAMSFTQDHHQRILTVLNAINAILLKRCEVYFGGGTLLALTHDEYRLSQDIDFLCASQLGYRQLRQAIFEQGHSALFTNTSQLSFPREIQADQYGIRFPVVCEEVSIKFEVVREGRIEFAAPERFDSLPVACLGRTDSTAEKLLANADRWPDTSVLSRDLIDLAVLRLPGPLPQAAFAKAEAAYLVVEPLKRAIANFQAKPDYRERCYQGLKVRSPKQVIDGLDLLASDFGLPTTERTDLEAGT